MEKYLTDAIRRALDLAPCSDRALAEEAGLAHSTLSRIRAGTRGASPAVALAIADALARWSEGCGEADVLLRDAIRHQESTTRKQEAQ